jgi:hypothetical protein
LVPGVLKEIRAYKGFQGMRRFRDFDPSAPIAVEL